MERHLHSHSHSQTSQSDDKGHEAHRALLRQGKVSDEDALTFLLELPLVWEADVKRMIMDLRDAHELDVVGLNLPERTPKKGHVLVRKDLEPPNEAATKTQP